MIGGKTVGDFLTLRIIYANLRTVDCAFKHKCRVYLVYAEVEIVCNVFIACGIARNHNFTHNVDMLRRGKTSYVVVGVVARDCNVLQSNRTLSRRAYINTAAVCRFISAYIYALQSKRTQGIDTAASAGSVTARKSAVALDKQTSVNPHNAAVFYRRLICQTPVDGTAVEKI